MKTAFLYAGQGSQYPGMGKDLYGTFDAFRQVIDEAEEYCAFDLKEKMFEVDADGLSETRYVQPVMAAFAAGVTKCLYESGILPGFTAGLSLGEYSALSASGVFDLKDLIKVTSFRGEVMEKAGAGLDTQMLAVIGKEQFFVDEVCSEVRKTHGEVYVANYNSEYQTVISGIACGVQEAGRILKEKGLRTVKLNVSSAFHTPFMKPASEALKGYFEKTDPFGEMKIPVLFNVTGKEIQDGETIPGLLEEQVMKPVRMKHIIRELESKGVGRVIEIGPGKVICGFIKKTSPSVECMSIEDTNGLNSLLQM